MRLVSEVNGISFTRGNCASRSALFNPALAAATTNAPSVGSPLTCQRPSDSSRTMCASEAERRGLQQRFSAFGWLDG